MVTIKTLFGQASNCAYPLCGEPLIFTDRGAKTVVAQIAHIRSEKPNGPRHDPAYSGDIDGPENLLLLCGKHHRPVDMHESIYSVEELEAWKAVQIAAAGSGTTITTSEARAFIRLSDEERQAISQVARVAERAIAACETAREALNDLASQHRQALNQMRSQIGPMWEVDEQLQCSQHRLVRRRAFHDRLQSSHKF